MLTPSRAVGFALVCLCVFAAFVEGDPVKVTIADGKVVSSEPLLPIDPALRIQVQHAGPGTLNFGLTVDGKRITCSPNGSIWGTIRIDGSMQQIGFNQPANVKTSPLPAGAFGKARLGQQSEVSFGKVRLTQITEVVSSKPLKASVGDKRKLDTCRITYRVKNEDSVPHKVEFRTSIDILVHNNDGALYASPTTHPGQVLNGIALEGKTLPPYLWVLEVPNFQNPGFKATMTFKHSQGEGPTRAVLANLGVVHGGTNQWDIPAQPAGDSACALYWNAKELKPGETRDMVWAYGGGFADDPDNEGKVTLSLNGSFEPNKLFTVTAIVDDPTLSQSLTLEMPPGLELVEGRSVQPVPPPSASGSSAVMWKGRVERLGRYEIKVNSSNGTTQSKHVTIEAANR